jgi:hypothetical protein
MNKIINIILSGLLWRKYKFFLLSLIVLIAFIFVVGQVHQDYLRYNELQGLPSNIGLSFAIKWLIWVASIVLFWVSNHYFNQYKRQLKELESEQSNSALSKLLKWKSRFNRVTQSAASIPQDVVNNASANSGANNRSCDKEDVNELDQSIDPFASIRKKDKLRSYADVVIEQKPDKPA